MPAPGDYQGGILMAWSIASIPFWIGGILALGVGVNGWLAFFFDKTETWQGRKQLCAGGSIMLVIAGALLALAAKVVS